MFAAVAADYFAFHPDRGARRDRAAVVDLHMARHGSEAPGANCFAHRLIEERSDDAAVQKTVRTLELIGDGRRAYDGVIGREEEFQFQPA